MSFKLKGSYELFISVGWIFVLQVSFITAGWMDVLRVSIRTAG